MLFFNKPYKKYQKELDNLYTGKYLLDTKYEELLKKTLCRSCPKYVAGKLPQYALHFPGCGDCEKYPAVKEKIEELDSIPKKADALIVGEYSRAVFDTYAAKAPALTRTEDQAAMTWEQVFGSDYQALSEEQRRDLVGLIEGSGAYTIRK